MRAAWEADAACKGMGDLFHPDVRAEADVVVTARGVCSTCPSQQPCLAYAMARPGLSGIYAGTTTRDRNRCRQVTAIAMKRRTAGPYRAVCVLCGKEWGLSDGGLIEAHIDEHGWWCVSPHRDRSDARPRQKVESHG